MPVTDYSQLETWQRAMNLAVSVPSNIAEGQGRGSRREFARFLAVARGSLSELETQVLLAERVGYPSDAKAKALIEETRTVGPLLNGLIRSVAPPADER